MQDKSSATFQLFLATGAFALCFAVFGSMSAMMPIISKHMALTPVQKSIAIAIPFTAILSPLLRRLWRSSLAAYSRDNIARATAASRGFAKRTWRSSSGCSRRWYRSRAGRG